MISPNDILNKKFDKGMGGYKTDAVEKYLEQVATQMSQLIDDKRDIEAKLVILAEKLEEYKNDEDSLRIALLSAQKLGDSVIREAKSKAEMILRDSSLKAERMVENAQKQIEREHTTLVKLQKEVANFKNRLMTLYKQHLELINALPSYNDRESDKDEQAESVLEQQDTLITESERQKINSGEQSTETPKTSEKEKQISKTTSKESDTIKFSVEDTKVSEKPVPEPVEKKEIHSESRFGPLRFGDGYELKREN